MLRAIGLISFLPLWYAVHTLRDNYKRSTFLSYFFQKMLIHKYDHSSLLVLRVILMHGLYGLCRIHLSRLLDKQVMKAHLCL